MHHGELCLYPVLKLVLHVVSCFANDVCFLVGSELSNNLCNLVCWNERNVREAGRSGVCVDTVQGSLELSPIQRINTQR